MIMEILEAYGIATAGADGYEADDVLGTLAAAERSDPVVVVSGDRDLLQLVDDDPVAVRVLYLGQGLKKATMFEMEDVPEIRAVQDEYLRLAANLWMGTKPQLTSPLKDREIFDLLGFE